MDRRRVLATVASLTIGAAGITAAVGATTRVFNVAEASPGVGRVSPVGAPSTANTVGPPVVDVEEIPASAGAVPASEPVVPSTTAHADLPTTTSTTPRPSAPGTSTPRPETESRGEDD
jgi:hypothetical protein